MFPRDQLRRQALLRGLAANPSTPEDIALRLVRLPELAAEVALERRELSEPIVAAVLALDDVRAARCLGLNGWSSPSVLARLAEHPDPEVRASAARDKLPKFVGPGCEVPTELLSRLAEDPDPVVRTAVAGHSQAPEHLRMRLAVDPAPEVRKAVADRWYEAPEDVLRGWLTDENEGVRIAALRWWWRVPPKDLHAKLLADPAVRAYVVKHIDLTPELIAEFLASEDEMDWLGLAEHPDLPASASRRLAAVDESFVHSYLMLNRNTPEDVRAQLTTSDFIVCNAWKDTSAVRWLREAPLEERLSYLDSPHFVFRTIVATATDLPQWAVDRLMRDPEVLVRRITAIRHPSVPGDLLEQLVREHGENVGFRPLISELPNFPVGAFERFATSDNPRLRAIACKYEDLPTELVAALANDKDSQVRLAAAKRPRIPVESLRKLVVDEDSNVIQAAGAASTLPVAWMYDILDPETG